MMIALNSTLSRFTATTAISCKSQVVQMFKFGVTNVVTVETGDRISYISLYSGSNLTEYYYKLCYFIIY